MRYNQLQRLEEERRALDERRIHALSLCREAEGALQSIRLVIQAQDDRIAQQEKLFQDNVTRLAVFVSDAERAERLLQRLRQEAVQEETKEQERITLYQKECVQYEQKIASLQRTSMDLEDAIVRLREKKEQLDKKCVELQCRAHELQVTVDGQRMTYAQQEQEFLKRERELEEKAKELQRFQQHIIDEETRLATRDRDLSIVRNRYADFARQHNIPFTVL